MKPWRSCVALSSICLFVLLGCASKPEVPQWSRVASDSSERAMKAQLEGLKRVAQQEWTKARSEAAKTGEPSIMARLALMECAIQVASLDWEECANYEKYAVDADPSDTAYAHYLYGGLQAMHIMYLPAQHRAVAQHMVNRTTPAVSEWPTESQPVARLVAVSAALKSGVLTVEDAVQIAEPVATRHGWRQALMAWLMLQKKSEGQLSAEKLERRLQVLEGK